MIVYMSVGVLMSRQCMLIVVEFVLFFFQAEDGIRDLVRSRGLGDVYKRQESFSASTRKKFPFTSVKVPYFFVTFRAWAPTSSSPWRSHTCLLYTSDAADERSSVDLGGRRIIKKKNTQKIHVLQTMYKSKTTDQTQTTIEPNKDKKKATHRN